MVPKLIHITKDDRNGALYLKWSLIMLMFHLVINHITVSDA